MDELPTIYENPQKANPPITLCMRACITENEFKVHLHFKYNAPAYVYANKSKLKAKNIIEQQKET